MQTHPLATTLGTLGFGLFYSRIMASKFALLGHVGMKAQMRAFLVTSLIEGVLIHADASLVNKRPLEQKIVRILLPCIVISSTNYFHQVSWKSNLISSGILGTTPLVSGYLAHRLLQTEKEHPQPPKKPIPHQNIPNEKIEKHKQEARDFQRQYTLPQDVLIQMFQYLEASDIVTTALVCRSWSADVHHPKIQKILFENFAFGVKDWNRYFGDVGQVPPFERDIVDLLKSPCPYWPDKKIIETHLLTLIPNNVNGQPFTLNLLRELIQAPNRRGNATNYRKYREHIKNEIGDQAFRNARWVLFTKDILPKSPYKTYSQQWELLSEGYSVPCGLEATASLVMHYVKNGERLYPNNTFTYTRCQENLSNNYRVAIGRFSPEGIHVFDDGYGHGAHGIGAARRL